MVLTKKAGLEAWEGAPDGRFWSNTRARTPGTHQVGYLKDPGLWTVLPDDTSETVGWRPILEPVGIELNKGLLGERITVWSGDHSLSGKLLEISEYDMILGNVLAWPVIEDPAEKFFKAFKQNASSDNYLFAVDRKSARLTHRWVRGLTN